MVWDKMWKLKELEKICPVGWVGLVKVSLRIQGCCMGLVKHYVGLGSHGQTFCETTNHWSQIQQHLAILVKSLCSDRQNLLNSCGNWKNWNLSQRMGGFGQILGPILVRISKTGQTFRRMASLQW